MVRVLFEELPRLLSLLPRHADFINVDDVVRIGYLLLRLLSFSLNAPVRIAFPSLLFLFCDALHLYSQQLPGSANCILSAAFAALLTTLDRLALEGRSATIEYEDGLDAKPKELADATKEADDVRVPQRIALLVTNRLEKLVYPDGGIDSEALSVEGCEVRRARARLHNCPETVHTHCCEGMALLDWYSQRGLLDGMMVAARSVLLI